MPAKDLGTKHTCWKCGTKFYDLKKPDPSCPKCGSDPRAAPVVKTTAAEKRAARPPKEPAVEETPELPEEDLDEEVEDAVEEEADADDE